MIHTEQFQEYLHSAAFLAPLGLPTGTQLNFIPLGQGEYNTNYTFLHPNGQKLVLRINTGSQMHLDDQIGYEYHALECLAPSSRTPAPLHCWPDRKMLVMEHLTGRALQYETDMADAACILADIHSTPVPENCRLVETPRGQWWCQDLVWGSIEETVREMGWR